ncbi:MAG: hypothetical protein KDA99_30100, partial [Planctomycetales bacterium]|nr:hypothetical protein [Planctomycetales bacterium]
MESRRYLTAGLDNWMEDVWGGAKLSDLSILGTHDTMSDCTQLPCSIDITGLVKKGARTQTESLKWQLEHGIRYVDMRVDVVADGFNFAHKFALVHNNIQMGYGFGNDVLEVVADFLVDHPSETVIMNIQEQGFLPNAGGTVESTFNAYMNDIHPRTNSPYKEFFWQPTGTEQIPKLADVRKKVVVLRDGWGPDVAAIGPEEVRWGLNNRQTPDADKVLYRDAAGLVLWQGKFNDVHPDTKWQYVVDQLQRADTGEFSGFYGNSLNATGGAVGTHHWDTPIEFVTGKGCVELQQYVLFGLLPCRQVTGLNTRLHQYLVAGNQKRSTGLVTVDFFGYTDTDIDLVKRMIEFNPRARDYYRVNAGGQTLSDDYIWESDADLSPFHNSGLNSAYKSSFISNVPDGVPMRLFQDTRWDQVGGEEMQWSFPVTPGDYDVRLYFTESYVETKDFREFDVTIEGQLVLENLDVFDEVGLNAALIKDFKVSADDAIDILFGHKKDNPMVSAIEIRRAMPDKFRVNVGGPRLNASPTWQSGSDLEGLYLNNNSSTVPPPYDGFISTFDYRVPLGTPPELFATERANSNPTRPMKFDFPVENGVYLLRLFWSENYVFAPNERSFNVFVEGEERLSNWNISHPFFELGGPHEGISWVINPVHVTDGNLDIDFGRIVGDPFVQGIELIRLERPDNDSFATPSLLVPGKRAEVDVTGATREDQEPRHATLLSNTHTVWYEWTPATSGQARISTEGSDFETVLAVYTGPAVNSLTEIAANDRVFPSAKHSEVAFSAQAGTTYKIAVAGAAAPFFGNADLQLNFTAAPPLNDNFANAARVSQGRLPPLDMSGATRETNEPLHLGNPSVASVWYTWTAPAYGELRLSTAGSNFDTILALYTGTSVDSLTVLATNDDVDGGDLADGFGTSQISHIVQPGTTYRVALAGYDNQQGMAQLSLQFQLLEMTELFDITVPGDPIVIVNGTNDTDGDSGPPPQNEGVAHAIDDSTAKYLNFLDYGSGFIVTPSGGPSVVSGLRLYVANDAPERDPATYWLEGSNNGPDGPYTTIAQGYLQLPGGRNPNGLSLPPDTPPNLRVGLHQEVRFVNDVSYSTYRLTFPTLKNADAANSMQIGEVELLAPAVVPDPVVYRINAGGAELAGDAMWSEDSILNPLPFHGEALRFSTTSAIDVSHPSIPAGTPMEMFQTQRYKQPLMQWDLPVEPGTYEVRLYIAELFYDAPGQTVFDVSIEGTVVLNDYDLLAEVGKNVGIMKRFVVTSDANLDIDFVTVVHDPIINGIEVIRVTELPGDNNRDGTVDAADYTV